jgi:putative flippase GtrA
VKLLALRWLKFNFVGAIGIAVQLVALAVLARGFHVHYLVATALAVEMAVLHNFIWHERFTWKDRSGGNTRATVLRLLRFHLGNGLVSIGGNLLLMRLLVGAMHWKLLIANAVTIAICSLLNFAVSERFVFRR